MSDEKKHEGCGDKDCPNCGEGKGPKMIMVELSEGDLQNIAICFKKLIKTDGVDVTTGEKVPDHVLELAARMMVMHLVVSGKMPPEMGKKLADMGGLELGIAKLETITTMPRIPDPKNLNLTLTRDPISGEWSW